MVELLLALPVVLLLGLGIAQFALVYQAKHALDYALTQAARQGAVDHASVESIRRGLAAGLVPYLYGAGDWTQLMAAEARAVDHVRSGIDAGWISLRQRSPSQESFEDWAEPALDAMGERIPGMVEIANDNLGSRRLRMQPASGVAGLHLAEPVGRLSGQTLADANLLRLELVYGVRLAVPVVGALVIRTLSQWNGCSQAAAAAASRERLGLLRLGEVAPLDSRQSWMCGFVDGRDEQGRAAGRIPIRASATVRMMSTARRSAMTQARADAASNLPSRNDTGIDRVGDALPVRGDDGNPVQDALPPAAWPQAPPQSSLANGFLGIGSDRAYPQSSTHPALCSG